MADPKKSADKDSDKPALPQGGSGTSAPKEEKRPAVTSPPGGMPPPPGAAGPALEEAAKDTRPPITQSHLNPTPTKGPALKGAEEDAARQAEPGEGTNAATSDGQQYRPPPQPTHQPIRPDATTQGQRPDVGGSQPVQTHPDNPAVSGPNATADLPEETEEATLKYARERAAEGSGNVYAVAPNANLTTGHKGHVTETDFPPGTDIVRLLRLGALTPVGKLRSDPRKAMSLGRDGLDEVDRLHDELTRTREERDRLKKALDEKKM